ncbi:MAG TPA: hypothetical protein PKM78_15180 [Anaerolineae bacterium]|nr:hypothetical protein [Anaerolineae bacterium]HNU05012.1 hypothetical protein [Anaerolineae bacterium]
MKRWTLPLCLALLSAIWFTALPARTLASDHPRPASDTQSPPLTNPGFECAQGFHAQPGIRGLVPDGWTALLLDGRPELNSTRTYFAGNCGGSGFIERIEGEDSLVMLAEDIETPPLPGKPFDAAVYQRTSVTPGVAYSLSAWMVSLCGGSAMPNDCPAGYTIAKLLGIDPTGGANPLASDVVWVEDRRNFTESGWANLRLAATAQSSTLTVLARIRSPYRWHGAHAFLDAVSLVQAPSATFVNLPGSVQGTQVLVRWQGSLGPDIPAIPGGTHRLLFDVQQRPAGQAAWRDWLVDQPAGQAPFSIAGCQGGQTVEFRLRARAEQPEGSNGAWPNHRYPGVWSQPASVTFVNPTVCTPSAYLPLLSIR